MKIICGLRFFRQREQDAEIAQIISGERLLKYLARDYFQIERLGMAHST